MLSAGLERKRAVVQFGLSEVEGEKTESRNVSRSFTSRVLLIGRHDHDFSSSLCRLCRRLRKE